jgi:hypothetical protein
MHHLSLQEDLLVHNQNSGETSMHSLSFQYPSHFIIIINLDDYMTNICFMQAEDESILPMLWEYDMEH